MVTHIDNPLSLEEKVVEALRSIFDPEIPVNIYDLGLIYRIMVDETVGTVEIQMTLTSPMCPVAQTFPQTVQDQILHVQGVSSVVVELVWDPPWTKERLSENMQLQLNLL
jgi:FeS assembly SUF system protein